MGKASQPSNNMVDGWIQKKVDTIRKFSLGQHRSTNQMVVNQDANVWVSSRELWLSSSTSGLQLESHNTRQQLFFRRQSSPVVIQHEMVNSSKWDSILWLRLQSLVLRFTTSVLINFQRKRCYTQAAMQLPINFCQRKKLPWNLLSEDHFHDFNFERL